MSKHRKAGKIKIILNVVAPADSEPSPTDAQRFCETVAEDEANKASIAKMSEESQALNQGRIGLIFHALEEHMPSGEAAVLAVVVAKALYDAEEADKVSSEPNSEATEPQPTLKLPEDSLSLDLNKIRDEAVANQALPDNDRVTVTKTTYVVEGSPGVVTRVLAFV